MPAKASSRAVRNRVRRAMVSLFRLAIIFCIAFVILYPLVTKFLISIQSVDDINDTTLTYLSRTPTLEMYTLGIEMMDYTTAFLHSALICAVSGLLHVAACTLVGYSLGRFRYPGRRLVFALVILTLMVPPQLISIPRYLSFQNFFGISLIDNPVSIFLLYATAICLKSGLYIYLMSQYFRNMPKELEEAALVDGAGMGRVLTRIMLPSARLMMVTVFLFTFVWQWTDAYYSSMFFTSYEVLPLQFSRLSATFGRYITEALGYVTHPMLQSQMNNVGSLLLIAPLVAVYLMCSRFFVEGIERSGIVG